MNFKLVSKFKPAGDQPKAIEALASGIKRGDRAQTLLGVTGSGKTFTVANVIAEIKRPTLVIAHNKTLAAQLCQEFREFFPQNAVHYFVSYYDYYQPEAYLPATDTYIDKEAMINDEIDRLRHAATQSLLSRRDVIVVASVSCIYGLGEPETYEQINLRFKKGEMFDRKKIVSRLIEMQFNRTNSELKRGDFCLRGDTLQIMPVNEEIIYRLEIEDGKIADIILIDPVSRKIKSREKEAWIFPAKHFITLGPDRERAIAAIRKELAERLKFFESRGKFLEAERLARRTKYDLEMISEMGYCHGIENYSRHLSGRKAGEAPATLLDYFPRSASSGQADFLTIIDESHVAVPQIRGMYEGDAARKRSLIEFGFRLPSASDNRPLKFSEFEKKIGQIIFTSATPAEYEREQSSQIVEQIIRPTGLVDPKLIIKPITEKPKNQKIKKQDSGLSQVDDLIFRVKEKAKNGERILVTVLTKKMAEDLTDFLNEEFKKSEVQSSKFKVQKKLVAIYLHSDVKALERIKILTDFRRGKFNVLVGVNLLREGLDLPEVTLVAILDADKEGFLRSETSLIQTIGRAARNAQGEVILYADNPTGSILKAVRETERRREMQIDYNKKHGITPRTIQKKITSILPEIGLATVLDTMPEKGRSIKEIIIEKERQMKEAARVLDFETAAILRDEIKLLKKAPRRGGARGQKPQNGN